jgi:hypothetical protein
MRYVVKDKHTGQFLRSSGEWTKYANEAQKFPNGLSVTLHLENSAGRSWADRIELVRLPLG